MIAEPTGSTLVAFNLICKIVQREVKNPEIINGKVLTGRMDDEDKVKNLLFVSYFNSTKIEGIRKMTNSTPKKL